MNGLFQSADWKKEKHVPTIDLPAKAAKNQPIQVTVRVRKEIAHPNTTEHHIEWIDLYFHPDGAKFPIFLGRYSFAAHGASAEGPNTSTVFTQPCAVCTFQTGKPGILHASSYCNIHGLWASSAAVSVE